MRNPLTLFTTLLIASLCALHAADEAPKPKPNIVIFLADDLGYGDLGCYGHPIIQTPNLDAFARQGTRFTQFYAASAVCSPSRSAILTGRTPYRNGVFTWIPEGREIHLRTNEIALPKLLKESGYTTCHVGKWHLNGHFNKPTQPQPNDHGYDWWLATQNNAAPSHENPSNFVRNGAPVGRLEGYSAPLIVDEATAWLKEHRDKSKPFLLSVWTHEPHYPIKAAPEFKAKYPDLADDVQREHHANVTQLDYAFGKLMRTLDELKLAENTVVIFTSDNGPEGDGIKSAGRGSTGGLRGRKRSVYEGGIRVPGIVRWPGQTQPGTTSDVPVIGSDMFVTAVGIAGAGLPGGRVLDGGDFMAAIKNQEVQRSRPLYWRYEQKMAMRIGDWKILSDPRLTKFELYNIKTDAQEKTELSATQPERFAEMKAALVKLNTEIEAEGPDWEKSNDPGKKNDRMKKKKRAE
jgi:arylsulfatase A